MVDAMTYPNPNYHGPCPYCGSAISVVIKDGTTVARCSHRGCGARGPIMRSTERAVELFRAGRCMKVGSGKGGPMLTRERIKEILSRSVWRTTRAEMAELLRLAIVGFDAESAARDSATDASGGVCDCSRSVGGPHPSCIACNGTGRKGGTDA